MKSTDPGFKIDEGWWPLEDAVEKAPKDYGIYFFRLTQKFHRLKGTSDILYIGSTINKNGGLRKRFKQYLRPSEQKTNERIKEFLDTYKSVGIRGKVKVGWIQTKKARGEEKVLLKLYLKEHCELPPLNRNH
jgi:hypothetical protein